jgi:uncharacterized protein (UPF0218 family)
VAGNFGALVQTDGVAAAVAGAPVVVAVGDVVSRTLHDLGIAPRLFICDYRTQRGAIDGDLQAILGAWGDREVRVRNPATTITREAWDAIRDALHRLAGTTRLVVDGEEDLLGIPCFLEVPVGAKVLYGAPGRGVVVVTVDAAFQDVVRGIVARMDQD